MVYLHTSNILAMQRTGLLLLGALLWDSTELQAQGSYPTDGCFIRYQYDAAGNRTQRDWYCMGEAQGGSSKSTFGTTEPVKGPLAEVHLNIAPNPASDQLRVMLNMEMGAGSLLIHDGQGREVMRTTMNAATAELDVSTLQPGAYFISYQREGERIVTGFAVHR